MSDRITINTLKARCSTLNRITKSPAEYWTRNADGTLTANIGHYYIDRAYGGFSLERITNAQGAVTLPLSTGHIPARDLYNRINAYIKGMEEGYQAAMQEYRK